jgi:surface antigen
MNPFRHSLPLMLVLILLAPQAGAVNWMFLEYSPSSAFTEEDWHLVSELGERALESFSDGQTEEWNNPASGNSGSVTTVKSYTDADGRSCRQLKVVERAKAMVEESRVDLCKQADGGWVLVTEGYRPGPPPK